MTKFGLGLVGCLMALLVVGCGGDGNVVRDLGGVDTGAQTDGGNGTDGGADGGNGSDGGNGTDGGTDQGAAADAGQCLARFTNCQAAPSACCATLVCDDTLNVCVSDTTLPDGGMCGGEFDPCTPANSTCCSGLVCTTIGQNSLCAPDFSADSGMCVSGTQPCDVTADACCPGTTCVAVIGNNGRCQMQLPDGGTCVSSGDFCSPSGAVGGTCCSGTCTPNAQFPQIGSCL